MKAEKNYIVYGTSTCWLMTFLISHKIFPQQFPAIFSHKIFLSWILIGWLPITLFQMLNFHQSLSFLNWLFPLLHFLQEFHTRFSRNNFLQDFLATISCKNFPQDFPTTISRKIFPQQFSARFSCNISPQDFPARFSRNIFLQDFPTRFPTTISRKIFPSWILIGWLSITLFQVLNFHQSLPFLNWLFPLLHFPQEFLTRFSRKIFLQDFPATISCNNFPQQFPATISHKIFLSWILIGWLPITLSK